MYTLTSSTLWLTSGVSRQDWHHGTLIFNRSTYSRAEKLSDITTHTGTICITQNTKKMASAIPSNGTPMLAALEFDYNQANAGHDNSELSLPRASQFELLKHSESKGRDRILMHMRIELSLESRQIR